MISKLKSCVLVSLIVAMLAASGIGRAEYTTDDISEATVSIECLDYCIIGVCIKLICTPYGCTTKTDPYVSHRLPDVVVSVYNQPGEISWVEARDLYGDSVLSAAQSISASLFGWDFIGGGYKQVTSQHGDTADDEEHKKLNNLKFKEVSIIGNPVIDLVNQILPDDYFCESEVTAFEPYMQTELDTYTWRTGISELLYPASWIPGMREIGTLIPPQSWGSVHPRIGYLMQEYDSLGAAVNAQRAIDVATREDQPHVYTQIPGVEPSDENTDKWGMVSPFLEPEYCTTFGKDLEYNVDRESPNNDEGYGWLYWALHECCPGVGITIARIRTEPVCVNSDSEDER